MPIRPLVIAVLLALAVAGCGRRGALEDPAIPEAASGPAADAAAFGGFLPTGPEPEQPPPPAPERRFPLDFLL